MSRWVVNTSATSTTGLVTETKDHSERGAFVNLTELGDGTAMISLSLVVPASNARAWAEALLRQHAGSAVALPPRKPEARP